MDTRSNPTPPEGEPSPQESPTATLARWRTAEPQEILRASIKTDPALQPRVEGLAPVYHWHRLQEQGEEHIACMRGKLAANVGTQLDPILVADTGAGIFLVDGHHRLRAYSLEKRERVPARILAVDRRTAQLVSKLVNLDGAKLPMHAEQRKDAAWQYLAEVTLRGRLRLPKDQSQRSTAARFGLSLDTVQRMLAKLPEVEPTEFSRDACDPGTGWPRWKHVRQSRLRGMEEKLGADAMRERKIAGYLKGHSKLIERYGAAIAVEAMHRLAADHAAQHADVTEQMLAELEGSTPDY